ncbi:MAG: sigma-54-dependent Fis family transcriptional regulator [Deltaproteobacteria bacterium]|nr:sigma-54-dependent Fis family transcriptional regulator [Deltaproteobacteria bacterium]
MQAKETILVVDDEYGVQQSFKMILDNKYNVLYAGTGQEAIDILSKYSIQLILLDIMLPDTDGLELLPKFKETFPDTEIIMVSAVKEIQTAVKAMKAGAYDYIVKPFDVEDIINLVKRVFEKNSLVKEVTYLRDELERFNPFEKIIGNDSQIKDIFELISTISEGDGTILIQGETGTGKELIARSIHRFGPRKTKPFVVVNCAAIPKTLMESEIFGHRKGAFTGAIKNKTGKLELADKGIIFFDDVDTLDINMQAKLLRVLQEKEFEMVGDTRINKVDIRFIASCNKNIMELISKGIFREDLYYRLNVFPIIIPPLRKRTGDIPLLLDYFLNKQAKKTGRPLKHFSNDAVNLMMEKYEWPGNVRELENLVERLFTIIKGDVININDIPLLSFNRREIKDMPLKDAVSLFEKQYISDVLEKVKGNKKRAAEILDIHRNTLHTKLNE